MSSGDISSIIIETARLDNFGNRVFSVGPFGARVGFAYQQNRALNLIYCLHTSDVIDRNSSIAIIGGGLAGVSARLALQGLGYPHVDLFEKDADVLRTQQYASHRPVHPNYNDWPLADRCSPTTNFPFLNWFVGDASSVVNGIRNNWLQEYVGEINKPLTHRKVAQLLAHPKVTEVEAIQLTCPLPTDRPAGRSETKDPSYSHVIVAAGFGPELYTEYGLSESYWDQDKLDRIRTEGRKCYVTAPGDGGLIDCIRLCCEDIPESNLLIELMARLRNSKYKDPLESLAKFHFEQSNVEEEIRDLEFAAMNMLPGTRTDEKQPFGSTSDNDIALFLSAGYQKIVRRLSGGVVDVLEKHVVNLKNVTLLGRIEAPFSCATAPINKLMIAFLLDRRPELYARAYIEWTGDGARRSGEIRFADGSSRQLEKDSSVIRLGSSPPVYAFSADFAKRNRTLMRSVAELTIIDRDDNALCKEISNVACADPASDRYVKHRKALAAAYAERYIGASLSEAWCPVSSRRYLTFDKSKPEFSERGDRLYLRTGGFPHDLFGIPLVGEARPKVTSALGGL